MHSVFKKLHYFFIIGVVVTMPFSLDHLKLNSYFIVLLSLNFIPLFFFSRDNPKPVFTGLFFLFASLYLAHVAGWLGSDNSREAVLELQKKASIFIFPLILCFSPKLNSVEFRSVLLSFVVSCLLTGLFCIASAGFHFVSTGDASYFFYHALSGHAGMHASYMAMYFCFSVAVLLFFYFDETGNFNFGKRIVFFSSLSVFVICIVLLGARMQIILLILGSIAYFMVWFSRRTSLLRSIGAALVAGALIMGLVMLFPANRERFKQAINYKGEYSINTKWGEQQFRPLMWNCAASLIKTNPVKGVGTGDVRDELQQCYKDREYGSLTFWKDIKLNAHNQYLETAIGLGLPGFILLVLGFILGLFHAYKEKKLIYFIFIILFAVSCITESMLERQIGIVFFAFFNSFLAFHSCKEN